MDRVTWNVALAVAVGSAAGGLLRYALSELLARPGASFPWPTLLVNVSGSLAIGLAFGMASTHPGVWTPVLRHGVLTGLLGGFTTFSAFSLQTLALVEGGQWISAAANAVASVLLGVTACWAGAALTGGLR